MKPLASQQFRQCVLIEGDAAWCDQQLRGLLVKLAVPLSSTTQLSIRDVYPDALKFNKSRLLFGQDIDVLIYDAHSGIDPDSFGIASGAVNGGGYFILLCPEFDQWTATEDPQYQRFNVWPNHFEPANQRFIKRLIRQLKSDNSIIRINTENSEYDQKPKLTINCSMQAESSGTSLQSTSAVNPQIRLNPEQQNISDHILQDCKRQHSISLLTAPRGRGKTTTLAQTVLALHRHNPNWHIVLTSRQANAVKNIFRHTNSQKIRSLKYLAPDAVSKYKKHIDLLVIDEAASLPIILLNQITESSKHVIISTTTHGYEGAGQGFQLRFIERLNQQNGSLQRYELSKPVRWKENDPLEAFTKKLLLLEPEKRQHSKTVSKNERWIYEKLDRNELIENETLLERTFHLLVSAHYQTSPADLRHLLDGSNIGLIVARKENEIAGVLMYAQEGEFPQELAQAIYDGKRRPRGHLLPQILCFQQQILEAASAKYYRIIRIAVDKNQRRNGIGSQLIKYLEKQAKQQNIDLLGATFAADKANLNFWKSLDYQLVRVGHKRDTASGEPALLVLKPKTERGKKINVLCLEKFDQDDRMMEGETIGK